MRLGMRIGMKYPQGGTRLSIASLTRAYVGAQTTITGTCPPGMAVTVTVGGTAFGTDSTTGSGTWSITAACPSVEGDNVPIVASAGGVSASGAITRVCVAQVATFMRGVGQTLRAGTYITAWTSQTGGHVAAQGSDLLQPTVVSGVVEHDGSNDYLENTNSVGNTYGNSVASMWVACAFRVDTANSDGFMTLGSFSSSHGELNIVCSPTETLVRMNNSSDVVAAAGALGSSVHVLVAQLSGGALNVWIDGVHKGTDASVAALDLAGLKLILGAAYSTAYCLDCGIYEFVMGTTLTTAQRQRLEAALAAVAAA
jgi:hypothetical protein